jgi:MATE family multidrug resistance protein
MRKASAITSEARSLLILGLPLVGSQVAQFAVHTTDTLMLGWYSVLALAQVTLGAQVLFIAFIATSGFAFAILPMVAKSMAEDDSQSARRATRMGLWVSTLAAALLFLPMWYAGPLLEAMGQDPTVAQGAQAYLRIAGFGLWPALWGLVLRSYLSALEHAGIVLWVSVFVLAANALINYGLIFGNWGLPELGLQGAAIASVISQILALLGFVIYIQRRFPEQQMFARFWRFDGSAALAVTRLAVPISATALAESGLFAASAFMMGWLGHLELAAHGIVLQLAALSFMVHMGLSQAGTVRAGKAFARNDWPSVRRTAWVTMGLSSVVAIVAIFLFLMSPQVLIRAFLDPQDPLAADILRIGTILLMLAALFQFVDAAQVVALSLLRGLQDTKVPMWIAAISYWLIGLPISYVLGFWLGFQEAGIWMGLVVGLGSAALLLWWRFCRLAGRVVLGFDHDPLGVLPHKCVRRSCMGLRFGIGSSITAILDQTFTKFFDSTTGF